MRAFGSFLYDLVEVIERAAANEQNIFRVNRQRFGRLPVAVTLDAPDENSLVEILTKPKNALIKQYQKLMEMDGAKLNFEDEALRLIAKEAIQRKTGARGLRSILEKIMRNVMFEVPSVGGSTVCTVTKEDVLFNQEPKLRANIKKTRRSSSQ